METGRAREPLVKRGLVRRILKGIAVTLVDPGDDVKIVPGGDLTPGIRGGPARDFLGEGERLFAGLENVAGGAKFRKHHKASAVSGGLFDHLDAVAKIVVFSADNGLHLDAGDLYRCLVTHLSLCCDCPASSSPDVIGIASQTRRTASRRANLPSVEPPPIFGRKFGSAQIFNCLFLQCPRLAKSARYVVRRQEGFSLYGIDCGLL